MITFDPIADCVYIYLADPSLPADDGVICDEPEELGNGLTVVIDWNEFKHLRGVEVVGARSVLHADLLAHAQRPYSRQVGAGRSPVARITYDPVDDTAYIYLTNDPLLPGRDRVACVVCDEPDGPGGQAVIVDWKDGKIVGIEVPTASSVLHAGLLAEAQPPDASEPGAGTVTSGDR